jgi:hypothetical protein
VTTQGERAQHEQHDGNPQPQQVAASVGGQKGHPLGSWL